MSLARAFFQAGARAVVGSQWPLRDDEAAQLIAAFYRYLGRGLSVDEALGTAQQDLIESGQPEEAWAGLTVFGDGSFIPFPGGHETAGFRLWWVFPAVALVTLVIFVLFRFRKTSSSDV